MKQLYWIDDNIQHMLYIVQGAISKFWKLDNTNMEGIASKILMFGNGCKSADTDELPTEEDERKIDEELFCLFMEKCMMYDGPDVERPVYNARKKLIQKPICFLYKSETVADLDAYKKMKCAWISEKLSNSESEEYIEAQKEAELLIERMCIEPESVVGIDIELLYGDLDRLRKGERILSMELCYKLSERNIKCFMYSTNADDDELRQNWEQMYVSFYSAKLVSIYQRNDFMQKGNADIVKEVEKMFG